MKEAITLHELNNLIKLALRECFPDKFWVRAELSEVRTTGAGHCYVEFIEKEGKNGNIIAKMRGNIWANTFRLLKPYFEDETNQRFGSGLKVLVQVAIDFHEVYGPSLTVTDIDPTFTIGDMMRQRLEIIRRLQEEQIFDQNKQLTFPVLPQRLAIISSATAAGFDDFMNQIKNNSGSYKFYSTLFSALMQGEQAENSILKALGAIELQKNKYDAVVIIRGGGAVSDLNCFDNYLLAKRCATFSLPIITGIGHERDESILDMVAHTRTKTPTAAAEFLISCFEISETRLIEFQDSILSEIKTLLDRETRRTQIAAVELLHRSRVILANEKHRIELNSHLFKTALQSSLSKEKTKIKEYQYLIKSSTSQLLRNEQNKLNLFDQTIQLSSPEVMLKKGFTFTTKNGRTVRSVNELLHGDQIVTHFSDGIKASIISK